MFLRVELHAEANGITGIFAEMEASDWPDEPEATRNSLVMRPLATLG